LVELLEGAAGAAREAVADTPNQLQALRDAGVVDAGGRGFELLFAACLAVVADRPLPEPAGVATPAAVAAHLAVAAQGDGVGRQAAGAVSGPRYEVMFFLHGDDAGIGAFKDTWAALGDSIVVVGGDGLWNCHVHTDDIGGAIEAGITAGRPADIRVTDLYEQVAGREEAEWVRAEGVDGPAHGQAAPLEHVTTAVVAVAVGGGLSTLLESLGVQSVVAGGQSMNPSTAQILEAVERCRADAVIVLPNNKNIVAVARQVPALAGCPVDVVPTTSVVEALAALVVYDRAGTIGDNVDAMAEAAGRVRAGEVTQAVRDGVAESGPVKSGDWIAITRDGIRVATSSPADAAIAVLDALVDDDAELVTLLLGAEADPGDTARIAAHLEDVHPDVELEVHTGDQPLYPYLVGVE
jgi:hypothetical protein